MYNYVRGEVATCHTSLCEAQALATVLRLHEEEVSGLNRNLLLSPYPLRFNPSVQTYTYLSMHRRNVCEFFELIRHVDPIEREMRRRIFFLLFQADKSESVLSGRPIRMREEECYSLRLPEEL